jgi:hypothetical protein
MGMEIIFLRLFFAENDEWGAKAIKGRINNAACGVTGGDNIIKRRVYLPSLLA